MLRALLAVALGIVAMVVVGRPVVAAEVAPWTVFETAIESTVAYDNPFTDVEVNIVFTQGDVTWRVPAFWDGGTTWRVRFAPPRAGEYRYAGESSDPGNRGFAEAGGVLSVTEVPAANPLVRRGFLTISADRRRFEHADGTPFLWLGDTWWKCLSKRLTLEDFKRLAADRATKGFNVVQIVCGPYPDEAMMEPRWANEGGLPYLTKDFSRVNPDSFRHTDRRIEALVAAGLVPAIVGGWGRPQHGGRSTLEQVGLEGFKRHWRHLVARYGSLPVVWIVGGEARDEYGPWAAVAAHVKEVDPYDHPLCYHAPGDPRTAIADQSPFDFDMVAIGHDGLSTAGKSLEILRSCLSREPRRPALCGEACYERHMQTNFEDIQRHLFWSFMLSGAAGHTYGAAGIWQASVEGDPGIDPVYDLTTWQEAVDYPGATQIGLGKKLLESHAWGRFQPHPEWAEPDCFAAGIPGEVRFIYRPKRRIYDWAGPVVKGVEADVAYTAFYFDPVRGRRFDLGAVSAPGGEYRAPRLPSPQDWVLVLQRD